MGMSRMVHLAVAVVSIGIAPAIASVTTQKQMLVGSDAGSLAHDFTSVAVEGDWAVASRPSNHATTSAVVFFQLVDGLWVERVIRYQNGGSPFELHGASASIRGDLAVVTSKSATAPGAAYIYRRISETNWIQEQRVTASDVLLFDTFGTYVQTDGQRVVVGAPRKVGDLDGAVYVFRHDGSAWIEEQKLVEPVPSQTRFGQTAWLEGDELLIGGEGLGGLLRYSSVGGIWTSQGLLASSNGLGSRTIARDGSRLVAVQPSSDTPEVTVFDHDGVGWNESARLEVDGAFGPISVSGSRMIIASDFQVHQYDEIGGVWSVTRGYTATTFVWTPTYHDLLTTVSLSGDELLVAEGGLAYDVHQPMIEPVAMDSVLPSPSLAPQAGYGQRIDADQQRLVVGAPDDGTSGEGAVYLYERSGSQWVGEQRIAGTSAGEHVGAEVTVHGDTFAVTAGGIGRVRVYRIAGGGAVVEEADLVGATVDFGSSLGLDGDLLAVGDPSVNEQLGEVRLYRRQGTSWTEETVLAPSGSPQSLFGWSVAVSEDRVIVGQPRMMAQPAIGGAARIYRNDPVLSWIEEAVVGQDYPGAATYFGHAVDIEGDRAVVSLPWGWPSNHPDLVIGRRVHVLRLDGSSWERTQILAPEEIVHGGYGVDIELDGDVLIVGSPGLCNAAHVYRHHGTAFSYLLPIGPDELDVDFGASVALSGALATVASPGDGPGAVAVKTLPPIGLMTVPEEPAVGDPLTFRVGGAAPGTPALLVVTGVSGAPLFVPLFQGFLDLDGQLLLTVAVPDDPNLPGTSVRFQAFASSASGAVVSSNERTVDFP